jgi:hypothetical protein
MKYLSLLALVKAIKISDQETCSSTAYLVQNGLEGEALAQVDEAFTYDPETGLIKSSEALSTDVFAIGEALGCASAGTNWGSDSGTNDNIYQLMMVIYNQNLSIIGKANASDGKVDSLITNLAALDTKVDTLKTDLMALLHDVEWNVIRQITGIAP